MCTNKYNFPITLHIRAIYRTSIMSVYRSEPCPPRCLPSEYPVLSHAELRTSSYPELVHVPGCCLILRRPPQIPDRHIADTDKPSDFCGNVIYTLCAEDLTRAASHWKSPAVRDAPYQARTPWITGSHTTCSVKATVPFFFFNHSEVVHSMTTSRKFMLGGCRAGLHGPVCCVTSGMALTECRDIPHATSLDVLHTMPSASPGRAQPSVIKHDRPRF
jgi:hypothetical protein